jgi:MerR family redox-sensitive transcriptional activator SoxR
MKSNDVLTIGELARRTGLSVPTIRFYEDKSLIEPLRTGGNQRRYFRADIRRLSFVLIAQKLGLSLGEIGEAMRGLPQGRTPNPRDWARISGAIKARIDRQIEQLEKVREDLDGCIGCGCLSLKKCALYNTGDKWGVSGAGPRVLR